jgi:hypothetical protein
MEMIQFSRNVNTLQVPHVVLLIVITSSTLTFVNYLPTNALAPATVPGNPLLAHHSPWFKPVTALLPTTDSDVPKLDAINYLTALHVTATLNASIAVPLVLNHLALKKLVARLLILVPALHVQYALMELVLVVFAFAILDSEVSIAMKLSIVQV